MICPVAPKVAFPHDYLAPENRVIEIDGMPHPYNEQYAWISIATLFELPATVVPISQAENGLPIGVQVMGDYLEDLTTIQFASLLEQ